MKAASQEDVLRSLRLWLSHVLQAPWDIWYSRDEVTERPGAFVQPSTPGTNSGSAYVRDHTRDYSIFAYPPGFEGEPAASRREAEQLTEYIDTAMSRGVVDGAYVSRTMRIPAYDYSTIPWDEAQPEDAEPFDFMPIHNWNIEVRVDPDDDALFTVMANLRVAWSTDGDLTRMVGPTLLDVSVVPAAPDEPGP